MLTKPTRFYALLLTTFLLLGTPSQAQETAQQAVEQLRTLYFELSFHSGVRLSQAHLKRFPDSNAVQAWRIALLHQVDKDLSLSEAEAMAQSEPASPWSHFALAAVLASDSKRRDEALQASLKAFEMEPDEADFAWMRSATLRRAKKPQEALDFAEAQMKGSKRATQLVIEAALANYELSRGKKGDPAKFRTAMDLLEEARRLDPDSVNARYLAGYYLARKHSRSPDGYRLLLQAQELAPSSPGIYKELWRALTALSSIGREEKARVVSSSMKTLWEHGRDNPEALRVIAAFDDYPEIEGQRRRAEDLLLASFPQSPQAERALADRFNRLDYEIYENDLGPEHEKSKQLQLELQSFLKRPQHHDKRLVRNAYSRLFATIGKDPGASPERILEIAHEMLKRSESSLYSIISHLEVASALAGRNIHLDEAQRFAQKAVDMSAEVYGDEKDKAPKWVRSRLHDTVGWIHFHQGRLKQAEKELMLAVELSPDDSDVIFHLGKLCEAKGDSDHAEAYYLFGAAKSSWGENPCLDALKALYRKRLGSLEGFDEYLAQLDLKSRTDRRKKVLASRHDDAKTYPAFRLKDLAGADVDSSTMRGKVMVVNFWGTWCGPCVREMPEFQELHEKYLSDPQVVIVAISNDHDPDELKAWMEKRGFDFRALIDDGYVSQSAQVRGFPTTWFIDPEGAIVFTKVGYTEKLVEEFSWRIEALRTSAVETQSR